MTIFLHMASAAPPSALEEAKQEKAKNDAALQELGKKIEKIEARIEELRALTERTRPLDEELSDLRKRVDALREEKKILGNEGATLTTSIADLRKLEAQQGAGTACNISCCIYAILMQYRYFAHVASPASPSHASIHNSLYLMCT
jgi:predicted RNase H-like nuclease (RuvC/YqgF family)